MFAYSVFHFWDGKTLNCSVLRFFKRRNVLKTSSDHTMTQGAYRGATRLSCVLFLCLAGLIPFVGTGCGGKASGDTIKVVILHSQTGTMAISEKSLIDAEKLAIEQIN